MAAEGQVKSLSFWAPDLEPEERARRSVEAQKLVNSLPYEGVRRDRDIDNIRMYEANSLITLYAYAGNYYSTAATAQLPTPDFSKNNRAKAAIDTYRSQVFTTDQRARFKVVDGNYRQRRRARGLQEFTDGLVHEIKLHTLRKRAGKDACVLESGAGVIQFFERDGRCAAQRGLATEYAIDPDDGMVDGQFQTLYRRRPMPRDRVKANWGQGTDGQNDPDAKPVDIAIAKAKTVTTSGAPADHIEVFECWHLPTGKDTKDGWHIIALEGPEGMLLCEEYTKDHHETVFFKLEDRFTGPWGMGLMAQARELQRAINADTYRVDRMNKLFSAGHLYLNKAARVEKSKLSNEIGSVWEGNLPAGEAMSFIQFAGATADLEKRIERNGQRIFENLGISQQASQGETNTGLNASAASKREDTVKSSQRNSEGQQRWEQFLLDCVRAALGIVRDIVTGDSGSKSGYKVAVPGKRGLSIVDWKDVAMDEKDYVLQAMPASPLPTDPAGLIAHGERMIEIGEWKPGELSGYLQDLDADGRTNKHQAPRRNLEKTFDALLYEPKAAAMPDEFTNYALAIEIGTEFLEQGMEDEVPEQHLERVRRYLKRCKKLLKASQAAQQPAQAAPVGQPAGAPATGGPPALAAV